MPRTETPLLTRRFDDALHAASIIHREHTRKGGSGTKPYLTHLLGVTARVLDNGGTEDVAIAALLHDSIEDRPKMVVLWGHQNGHTREELAPTRENCVAVLASAYGPRVAQIVDSVTDDKIDWKNIPASQHGDVIRASREKKFQKLRALQDSDVILLKACDVLDNANSLLHDREVTGPDIWGSFRGGRDGTLWYYNTFAAILKESRKLRLAKDLRIVTARIYEASVGDE